jgi:hypothetical protein
MADHRAIPPPAPLPTFPVDWRRSVDDRLDDIGDRLESIENDAACLRRTEAKVDEVVAEQREIKGLLLRVVDREASREPMQERDLGNLKTEMVKVSASSGRRWGVIAGGSIAGVVTVVTQVWEPIKKLIELLR